MCCWYASLKAALSCTFTNDLQGVLTVVLGTKLAENLLSMVSQGGQKKLVRPLTDGASSPGPAA